MAIKIAMDIETVALEPSDEQLAEAEAKAKLGRLVDEDKIEAKKQEAVQRYKDNFWLRLDGSRIISVAVCMVERSEPHYSNLECWYGDDPNKIMKGLYDFMVELSGVSWGWVTFNGQNFDLPLLSVAYARAGLPPLKGKDKWSSIDLAHDRLVGLNRYGAKHYYGLKEACRIYGVPHAKNDGSDVAGMYADKDWDAISKYNKKDAVSTALLAYKLSLTEPTIMG